MTTSSSSHVAALTEAKQALKSALARHAGDPDQPEVADAIAHLCQLCPVTAPTRHPDLQGHWQLISAPNFPDGELQADGSYVYTLGRLAFNRFQPRDLTVKIERVLQPVRPIADSTALTHDIEVHFQTSAEQVPPLNGIVRNLGVCEAISDTTLQVQFTGGVLVPAADTDLPVWSAIFDPSRRPQFNLQAWLQGLFLKVIFGITPTSAMDPKTGRVSFQMRRSPKGRLEVIYLDDELRITRSQKETVLVCERL